MDDPAKTRSLEQEDHPPTDASSHLLVVDGSSASTFLLPRNGVVLVGRGPEAQLRLDAAALSRRHANLVVADGDVSIADLESHNGTLVNNDPVRGSRRLFPGDVVTLGEATMILRGDGREGVRYIVDTAQLHARLKEEVERASEHGRPLAVLAVNLGATAQDPRIRAAAISAVRRIDTVGWLGATQIGVVLPELGGDAARELGLQILKALTTVVPQAKAGLACCPADGCDAATLFAGARAAADMKLPVGLRVASEAFVQHRAGDRSFVFADPAMICLYDLLARLAKSDLSVLILGEPGVGKENAAEAIHHGSDRRAKPLLSINCAALTDTVFESEVFGHVKGAFTGASSNHTGILEAATGGSVFFDEVAELHPTLQAKLLRAIQEQRIRRMGEVQERAIDVRFISATNKDLDEACRSGRFREDLKQRLSGASVRIPPLRARPREIPILARLFLDRERARKQLPLAMLSDASLRLIAAYPWRGNVRELRQAMEFAVAMMEGDVVEPWTLPEQVRQPSGSRPELGKSELSVGSPRLTPLTEQMRVFERAVLTEALEQAGGVQTRAAELLSVPLRTFVYKLKQHGLSGRGGGGAK